MQKPRISGLPPEFAQESKKEAVLYLLSEIKLHLEYAIELRRRASRLIDFQMK